MFHQFNTSLLAVQGLGGGAIVNLGSIVLSDLVPLSERGTYQGILILVWALAAGVGPLIVRHSTYSRTSGYKQLRAGWIACARCELALAVL